MKLANLKTTFLKGKLKVKQRSPEILLVAGIVGVVGSVVLACFETTKASEIAEEANESLAEVKKVSDDPVMLEKYSPEDKRKDLTIIYTKTGLQFVKLYLPSALLLGVSIFSLVSSHRIMRKRNAELVAAYSALGLAFREYRKRVTDTLGADADDQFCNGIKAKEFTYMAVDPATGEAVEKKDILAVVEDDCLSPYTFYFERPNPNVEDSIQGNLMWLGNFESKWNDTLMARASACIPVFLNEVLMDIGFDAIPEGQLVGWRYDPDDPKIDSAVKFRARVVKKPDGVGNYYDTIMLDFNVDGDVLTQWAV